MTECERIEQEIREVLDNESQAIPLSNKLFSPDGLFSRLASTEEERRVLVRTPLFKQAQRRFMALQRAEAEAFAKIAEQVQALMPQGGYRLKLEPVEAAGSRGPQARGTAAASRRETQEEARPGTPDGSRHP
jgi:hypothetical protein